MFSRKIRKLSLAVLMFVVVIVFSFCIINNYAAATVNANIIQIDNISVVYAPASYQVYETNLNEVFPALPLEGELYCGYSVCQSVALMWYTDGVVSYEYESNRSILKYIASFEVPNGYRLSDGFPYPTVYVEVIADTRPTVTSLNDCSENVLQNQEYTLPKTLKGTVDGVDGLVDIDVTWDSVADTTENGTKVYTATAVNSFNYKVPNDKFITAKLTLTVGNEQSPVEFKHYYQKDEIFKSIEMAGYTFLGWAKADNASLGVFEVGKVVLSEGEYFPILVKLEYLGVSFKINEQGVRFGFALKFFGLDNGGTDDNLKTSYVDTLLKEILESATFTATIYGEKFDYTYTENELKYEFMEDYQGYVSNLVFAKISDAQLDESVKVDAKFVIASKSLSVEGKTCTIRAKAQEAYDKTRFDVEDQATIDKMVQMYGVKAN